MTRSVRISVALVLSLAVLSAEAQDAWGDPPYIPPYIHLGRQSDTLDQPHIEVELADGPTGIGPYGSGFGLYPYNRLLLDTGANSILFVSDAADDLLDGGMVNEGLYYEQGVAGYTELHISAPYAFSVTDSNSRTFTLPQTDTEVRVLNDPNLDLPEGWPASQGGITGIVGMSAMADRVVTLDFTDWFDVTDYLDLGSMDVVFPIAGPENPVPVLPEGNGHRYSVSLDTRRKFDPAAGLPPDSPPDAPLPVWADIPFMTAVVEYHDAMGRPTVQSGDFLLDTGAQMSLITREMAFALGLDADGDGALDNIGTLPVGGIGGTVEAELLWIDKIRLPTDQGVDLLWAPLDPEEGGLLVLVLPEDATQLPFCVFGVDFLTGGITLEIDFSAEGDPYFEKVHFDFRNWSVNGEGKIYFDLNGDVDETIGILMPGDANRDGVVNDADASILAANWQATGVGWSEGDFNGDGVVNELDASILAVYWQDDPPLIPGDANEDGVVDDADASILAAHWQQSGEDIGWEDGDFNGDGMVDGQDASIMAAHWQNNGEGSTPVPEPATSTLLILAALTLLVVALAKRQK